MTEIFGLLRTMVVVYDSQLGMFIVCQNYFFCIRWSTYDVILWYVLLFTTALDQSKCEKFIDCGKKNYSTNPRALSLAENQELLTCTNCAIFRYANFRRISIWKIKWRPNGGREDLIQNIDILIPWKYKSIFPLHKNETNCVQWMYHMYQ